jgi:hypothetical protein
MKIITYEISAERAMVEAHQVRHEPIWTGAIASGAATVAYFLFLADVQ